MSYFARTNCVLCGATKGFLILLAIAAAASAQESLQLGDPTRGLNGASAASTPRIGQAKSFNAVGRILRVKRKDTGAIRYALTDDDGSILAFIAPTARKQLDEHIGTQVGITARTFGADDDIAPHVLVDKITPVPLVDDQVDLASFQVGEEPALVAPINNDAITFGGEDIRSYAANVNHEIIPDAGCAGCGDPGCSSYMAPTSCTTCGVGMPCQCPRPCGPPGWLWLRGEYLLWFSEGMDLPPLVTRSDPGTPTDQVGVLPPDGNATVIFGDDSILTEGRSGFRIKFGGFLGPRRKFGWEAEYFDLGDIDENFTAGGNNELIGRPFFNLTPAGNPQPLPFNDAELVNVPGLVTGTVDVQAFSQFNGAAGRFRWNLCCKQKNICNPCNPYGGRCGYPPYSRIDLTTGYRYYGLAEGINIRENLLTADGTQIQVFDSFETDNDFHGGEIGILWEAGWNRWSLETLMRTAIGGTRQRVDINGSTIISQAGIANNLPGGVAALPSNIGTYERNSFTMIPELSTTLGLYLTPRMRFLVGYSLIYWSNVVRPGDQISLDLNTNQFPPQQNPLQGPLRPDFAFRLSDFWAQGLNVGLDVTW